MTVLDESAKQQLVEQFRASLDRVDLVLDDDDPAPDLRTLLSEMAVLKSEVRLQARQFKATLEELRGFGETLREQNGHLQRELDRARTQATEGQRKAERGLLLGLLELRDRLQAGLDAVAQWRPSPVQRLLGGGERFSHSVREGSTLTLQRLDELLASHRVRPITSVGQPLDPRHMHAVAVESLPRTADGIVLRELRRGFYQGDELLRAADVIVNKQTTPP